MAEHANDSWPIVDAEQTFRPEALFLLIIPLATLFGNLLVMRSVVQIRTLHSPVNYYIFGLAFADFLVAVAVMPFAVYVEFNNNQWELGDMLCDIYCSLDVACSTSSILLLAVISFDRFVAVTNPIEYAASVATSRVSFSDHCYERLWGTVGWKVILTNIGVWVISLAIASPMVFGWNNVPSRNTYECRFYEPSFIIFSSVGSFGVPCIITIALYVRIFVAIRAHARKQSRKSITASTLMTAFTKTLVSANSDLQLPLGPPLAYAHGSSAKPSTANDDDVDDEELQISLAAATVDGDDSGYGGLLRRPRGRAPQRRMLGMWQELLENIRSFLPKNEWRRWSEDDRRVPSTSVIIANTFGASSTAAESSAVLVSAHYDGSTVETPFTLTSSCPTDEAQRRRTATPQLPLVASHDCISSLCFDLPELDLGFIDDSSVESSLWDVSELASPARTKRMLMFGAEEYASVLPPPPPVNEGVDSEVLYRRDSLRSLISAGSGRLGTGTASRSNLASIIANVDACGYNDITSDSKENDGRQSVLAERAKPPRIHFSTDRATNTEAPSMKEPSGDGSSAAESTAGATVLTNGVTSPLRVSSCLSSETSTAEKSALTSMKQSVCSMSTSQATLISTAGRRLSQQGLGQLKKRALKSERKEKKATQTLAIVLVVFLVCWVPFFTTSVVNAVCIKLDKESCQIGFLPFFLTTWLGYMNSALNPIIYTIFSVEFRRAFKIILCGQEAEQQLQLRRRMFTR